MPDKGRARLGLSLCEERESEQTKTQLGASSETVDELSDNKVSIHS